MIFSATRRRDSHWHASDGHLEHEQEQMVVREGDLLPATTQGPNAVVGVIMMMANTEMLIVRGWFTVRLWSCYIGLPCKENSLMHGGNIPIREKAQPSRRSQLPLQDAPRVPDLFIFSARPSPGSILPFPPVIRLQRRIPTIPFGVATKVSGVPSSLGSPISLKTQPSHSADVVPIGEGN
jgi:hypothetical protein